MTRRAIFTRAEIRRAIRAAREEGAETVEIEPDGRIVIRLSPSTPEESFERVIVL